VNDRDAHEVAQVDVVGNGTSAERESLTVMSAPQRITSSLVNIPVFT
jgi:hypothetical protein